MTKNSGFESVFNGKTILVTGHTGFTGSWISLWLAKIGAKVVGYAQEPATEPSMYNAIGIDKDVVSIIGDIKNASHLADTVRAYRPDFILHLAAQALVRRSYRDPLDTFETNTMGTVNLLEAARHVDSVKAVVCVTTDKVYRNNEWAWPYRENDVLGGHDPYSASKAAAELAIESYSKCFASENDAPSIAVARGGNIIGGGDWAEDRLIPDFVRAVTGDGKLTIRYPEAVRPWQHVLALSQGYLMLLAALYEKGKEFAKPWNFGPADDSWYSVRQVLDLLSLHWQQPEIEYMEQPLSEAMTLSLDSSMARRLLKWSPSWDTRRTVEETARWYKAYSADSLSARLITESQIDEWRSSMVESGPSR